MNRVPRVNLASMVKRDPKGETGPQGEKGEKGETGEAGPKGNEGSPWTVSGRLPSGKTETGTWAAGPFGAGAVQTFPISFPIPLTFALTEVHFLKVGEGETLECPGTVKEPKAAPGDLCVYAEKLTGLSLTTVHSYTSGVVVEADYNAEGLGFGTWAVTEEKPSSS